MTDAIADKTQSISLQELSENWETYKGILDKPLAITSQGNLIGYFLPIQSRPNKETLDKLLEQGEKISTVLDKQGIDEDEIVAEFRELRKQSH